VTDDAYDPYAGDDAVLLFLLRDGDTRAFEVLRERHRQAARRLALCLVPAEQADGVVAEAFDRVLDVTLRGDGPADAFRPYLLAALRRVSHAQAGAQHPDLDADAGEPPDLGEPLIDPAVAGLETSLIVRAFRALPARWIAVLWHIEIEDTNPAELTEILGLAPGEAATLRRRARIALRQAYLDIYLDQDARPECQPVARQLAVFATEPASGRNAPAVAEHLTGCRDCDGVAAELDDIEATLRAWVAPVFLGSAAESYLSAELAAAPRTATTGAAARHAAAAAGTSGRSAIRAARQQATRLARQPSRPLLWVSAAAALVIAVAVALALAPARPGAQQHQQAAEGMPAPGVTPAPARPTTAAPTEQPKQRATASPPAATPPPVMSLQPPNPAATSGTQLSASASVGLCFLEPTANEVTWTVRDTGSAATGELTVSLTLPQGTSLESNDSDQAECDPDATGASCQPTAGGASCQLSGISPGSQAQDTIVVAFDSIAACDQPVQVAVSSGSTSASAQAPGGINCSELQ
jgi:DNA-directed RNA polymerase specialized sigma24 family protein